MSLKEKGMNLIKGTVRHIRNDGLYGVQWPMWMAYNEMFVRGTQRRLGYQGENVFEKDWDLLILMDACRVDLLSECRNHSVVSDSEWGTTFSIAPDSTRFLNWTFNSKYEEEIDQTAYISANPHTDTDIGTTQPDTLDEVWKYAWDDDLGTVPARAVTDRAISTGRKTSHSRYIVHYMQPHFPSVPNPELGSGMNFGDIGETWTGSIWDQLLEGKVSHEEVWSAYRNNLSYVLDEVDLLLENFDADDVVISADHGNAVGERGFYGHDDYPVRAVWEVPWLRTSSADKDTHSPRGYERKMDDDINVEDQLSALGYI